MTSLTSLPATLALLVYAAAGIAADCPPRTVESWEHSVIRAELLRKYNKDRPLCTSVDVGLVPARVQVDGDRSHASLSVTVVLTWIDPGLTVPGTTADDIVTMNASDIWTPRIRSTALGDLTLTPTAMTSQVTEVRPATGAVSSYMETTLRGQCDTTATAAAPGPTPAPAAARARAPADPHPWPRDVIACTFYLRPPHNDHEKFAITHQITVQNLMGIVQLERLSSWRLLDIGSELLEGGVQRKENSQTLVVRASLQRLPGQIEVLAVQPGCVVAALVPVSAALAPWSGGRAAMVAISVLLHGLLMLALPEHLADQGSDLVPKNVLLYRDWALLLLLVAMEWLVSLGLASRRKPLTPWFRPAARTLAMLRTPLLLPVLPAALPPPPPSTSSCAPKRALDEESVGLAEVLDRLTLLVAGAAYLAIVVASLQ